MYKSLKNTREKMLYTLVLVVCFPTILTVVFLWLFILRWTPTTSDESIISQQPCAPPCWHDLYPGRSTQQDVRAVLARDGFIPNWLIVDEPELIRWHWSQEHKGYFLFDAEQILRSMSITSNFRYSIEDILALYGEPAAVRQSRLMRTDTATSVRVKLSLYYPAYGLVAHLWLEDEPKDRFVITTEIYGDEFELYEASGSLEQFILQVHSRLQATDIDTFIHDEFTLGWPGYGSIITARPGVSLFLDPLIIVTPTSNSNP